jgi:hypothetical protein
MPLEYSGLDKAMSPTSTGGVRSVADNVTHDLHELMVREQIGELRARYCWYVARGDYEGVIGLYTPDGVYESSTNGARQTFRGASELRERLSRTVQPGRLFPMIHAGVTVVNGNEAYGTCTMQARTANPDMPTLSGYYHDRFRVHANVWLFSERRFFTYQPTFERSGLDMIGAPDVGLSASH